MFIVPDHLTAGNLAIGGEDSVTDDQTLESYPPPNHGESIMTGPLVDIGSRKIGEGMPTYVIAEIGNHQNGSVETTKRLIKGLKQAGADAVKIQKRPQEQDVSIGPRKHDENTSSARVSLIEYQRKFEFGMQEYAEIDRYCKLLGIDWMASCWDEQSIDFMAQFEPPFYRLASASLTNFGLLKKARSTGRPLMVSTGMSTVEEIITAVEVAGIHDTSGHPSLMIAHSASIYPCKSEELNLRMIGTLRRCYPEVPIGYSGHETGLAPSLAAVTLGAAFLERHVTLYHPMRGTDRAVSVELAEFEHLVREVRDARNSLGDGIKRVCEKDFGRKRSGKSSSTML